MSNACCIPPAAPYKGLRMIRITGLVSFFYKAGRTMGHQRNLDFHCVFQWCVSPVFLGHESATLS